MSRTVALVVNPVAGQGRGRKAGLIAETALRDAGLTVRTLVGGNGQDSADLAQEAVADGVDTLAVVGGDGMVHLGIQAVARTEVALGVIPAGSGDDFARATGLPRRDAFAAAGVIAAGRTRVVDLGRSEGTWFAGVVAAGFDALVNERTNRMRWPRNRLRYNLAMLLELGVLRPIDYVIELEGKAWPVDGVLVAVGNSTSYGGGMKITPGALLDDGMLDVVVVRPLSRNRLLRLFPTVYSGTHVNLEVVEVRRARTVGLSAPGIVAYADGERLGPLPRSFEAVPGALRLLTPIPFR